MSQWREQVIKCKKFYLFAIGRGFNLSFNINNRTNFFGEIFWNTHKNYKLNLVLVLVVVLKSKDLYYKPCALYNRLSHDHRFIK